MVLFEGMAITTAKPIVIAGVTTYLLDKSGFDFSQIPVVGGFWNAKESSDGEDFDDSLTARYFCNCFGNSKRCNGKNKVSKQIDSDGNSSSSDDNSSIHYMSLAMSTLGAMDVIMSGVLLSSLYLPVDQPLKQWILGGLVLGFPTSALVYNVSKKVSFRHAFLVESAATLISFGWLSYGILIVSKSTAYKTAPLLFWTVYGTCVTSWSLIGTSLLGLILTTVVAMSFGNKPQAIAA